MRALSLMFHDVVENSRWDSSGFPGPSAAAYKLAADDFERHLDAIAATKAPVALIGDSKAARPVYLTFDDGGASGIAIASALERRGWRGHFFLTTDRLGEPAFLSREQARELRARGHIVGSHSCSHPARISACDDAELARQWRESVRVLSELTGEPITVASVPGGFYSRRVAQAAAAAGITSLFTSEPTTSVWIVNGCQVRGRYHLQRGMGPKISAAFVAGHWRPRLSQALLWNLKKLAKTIAAEPYRKARDSTFR